MKALRFILPFVLVFAIVHTACEPIENISEVPEINFKSYTRYLLDTLDITLEAGELVFSFQDGDSDLGLDTIRHPEDTANLYLIPFQKLNGVYEPIDQETYGRTYAILANERLYRTGQNKTIRGEIKVQIYYLLIPPYDTIRYDFYIVDRAGHESNVESTPDIPF